MKHKICITGAGNISNIMHIPILKVIDMAEVVYVIGVNYVDSVQWRYFIPIFLFVIVLFCNKYFKKHEHFKADLIIGDNLVVVSSTLLSILTILTVYSRFW